jgi:hypothetical protein
LLASGFPIVGDELYGPEPKPKKDLALRAISLSFNDPFDRKRIRIRAATDWFLREYGFQLPKSDADEPKLERIESASSTRSQLNRQRRGLPRLPLRKN